MSRQSILDRIRTAITSRQRISKDPALGAVYLKPSEATQSNVKRITDAGVTATVVSGTPRDPRTTSFVSGGGGRIIETSTPAQTQLELEKQRVREAERQRAEQMKILAEQNREAERRRLANKVAQERSKEAAKIRELQTRANIEKQKTPETIKKAIKQLEETPPPRKGVYVPPTDEFGKSQQYYLEKDLNSYADKLVKELQAEVNKGNIYVDDANKLLEGKIDNKYQELLKKYGFSSKPYTKEEIEQIFGFQKVFSDDKKTKILEQLQIKLEELTNKVDEKRAELRVGTTTDKIKLSFLYPLYRNIATTKEDIKLQLKKDTATSLAFAKTLLENLKGLVFVAQIISDKDTRSMVKLGITSFIVDKAVRKDFLNSVKKEGGKFLTLLKYSPSEAIVQIAGEYFLGKGIGTTFKIFKKLTVNNLTRLSPKFKKLQISPFGIESIKGVNKVGDIEIIPRLGETLKTSPKSAVKKFDIDNQFRKNPIIPPTTPIEKEIIDLVKKNDDIITGSFARETLLKKQFTRVHKDLDIASRNIPALLKLIKDRFGTRVSFKPTPNSVLVKINGKGVADIVPYSRAEGGFIKKFGYITVNGLKVANPKAILAGKTIKLGTIKVGTQSKTLKKTLKDLEKFSGEKLVGKPSIKGPYGSTKLNKKYLGKSGPLTTSQADLLTRTILKRNPKLKLERWLYATPWEINTGKAQVRVSRLALKSEVGTLLDLIRGRATLRSSNPQIFVLPKQKIFKAGTKLSKLKTIPTKDGFVIPNFTSELEVVLGKGYVLSRGKKLGVTIIAGEKIPIIELKLTRLSPTLRKEVSSLNKLRNNLNKVRTNIDKQRLVKEIDRKENILNKKLKAKTGFDYFSERTKSRKVYPLGRKISAGITRVSRYGRRRTPLRRRTTPKRTPTKRTTTPRRTTSRKTTTPRRTTPRRTTPRVPTIPRRTTPRRTTPRRTTPRKKKPFFRLKGDDSTTKRLSKKPEGYNVYVKSRGKFIKANTKPLSKVAAQNRKAYIVDHSTAVIGKIKPVGKVKKLGSILPKESGARKRIKARRYRIVKGKRVPLQNKIIERRGKPRIDTPGEKRGLTAARLISQIREKKRAVKKTSKKRTSAIAEQRLKNLKKARRVLAQKRRKK